MDEQQKLMKRAVEAYADVCREENGEKFFTWFEEEFCVGNYKKRYIDGYHSATINEIGFVWNKSREMSVTVFGTCKFCEGQKALQNSDIVVRTLEELGEFIGREDDGTFYFNCGKHNSLDANEQNQSAVAETIVAIQEEPVKPKMNGNEKRECVAIYLSDENYESFEKMFTETKRYVRKRNGIELKRTHVAELALKIAYNIFDGNKSAFLSLVDSQFEKSDL